MGFDVAQEIALHLRLDFLACPPYLGQKYPAVSYDLLVYVMPCGL